MHPTARNLSRTISAASNVVRRSVRAVPRRIRIGRPGRLPTAGPPPRQRQPATLPTGAFTCSVDRGLVQISVVRADDLLTVDGVPVCVMTNLAWSSNLPRQQAAAGQAAQPSKSSGWASPCSCARSNAQESTTIQALATAGLRELVQASGLAELLCDTSLLETRLHQDIGDRCADQGISVHVLRIREVGIPGAVQAAADARQLMAMRASRKHPISPPP